jgi:peptidoglycan/LPS O-acetylase OafA/YrhL
MLWSLTPAGFLAGLAGVYCWRRRGAIVVPVLGVIVGGGVALAALFFPDPSQADPYPPNQAFAATVGVVASVLWLFGSSVGIVTGFALWPSKPQKNSGDTAPHT